MIIAIASENDFGLSSALTKANHAVSLYECGSLPSLFNDIHNGYKPDCIFLKDNGEVAPPLWHKDKIKNKGLNPALVYFTRESLKISENDLKKIKSRDLVLTQNNHWLTKLAFNNINILRFPYWVDTNIFFPDDSQKQYDCVCCLENLNLAEKLEHSFSSRGLTFLNDPNGGANFLNRGRVFLNFENRFVVPRLFFEASACGLPILSTRLHDYSVIESIFEEEKEILYFSSLDECLDRAYLYAKVADQRRSLAEKSFYLIKNYHTIKKRIRVLIKEIKTLKL